jgi:hypothetical protein
VLVVGNAADALLQSLDAQGCSVAYLPLGGVSLDEARVFASTVEAMDPWATTFPEAVRGLSFDAILFYSPLERFSGSSRLLLASYEVLRPNGVLIAGLRDGETTPISRAGFAPLRLEEIDTTYEVHYVVIAQAQAGTRSATVAELPTARSNTRGAQRDRTVEFGEGTAALERSASGLEASASRLHNLAQRLLDQRALLERELRRHLRELQSERVENLRLQIDLALAESATAIAELGNVRLERAWYELYVELESARADARTALSDLHASLESTRKERDKARAEADFAVRSTNAVEGRLSDSQRRIAELESDIKQSEKASDELRAQIAAATERDRETRERTQEAIRDTEARLEAEAGELRERAADAERTLAAQTDAMIATMQAENAKLSHMIDVVQSGRLWRLKRWLNRLRGRAFR